MGLLSIIRKQKLKDKEIRILMLGLDNAGKTTIVKKLLNQNISEISPTMGFQIDTLEYIDPDSKDSFRLNVWDVGGQSTLRPFWFNYFEKTDSLIWVVDILSMERMQENFVEFEKVLKEDRLIGSNLLILVNKTDLLEGNDSSRVDEICHLIEESLQLKQIKNHNYKLLPCSAYTGANIEEGIKWIVDEIKERLYLYH
ncbi:GTP-binding protein [Ascoidea rubescens DSM 1968]|uniref:GTP-binding protein n=1 Tax=Ascoidea rubescens DSM 1968 TaxID=1344418 RepID=A0A1D2VKK6_9ASCO|nr:GTP-binding protein [Ascoidea rubescens DSM 1968]XP_020048443.1 GTP-binding protein [Ascoidea rubescens DSM 1968]ODV61729.1 GTP-binding protein [Ascoidea rubescens DSM 1968]ODV62136.1 GTP-binding protein [Ascoidea rubescens DSM 1968]